AGSYVVSVGAVRAAVRVSPTLAAKTTTRRGWGTCDWHQSGVALAVVASGKDEVHMNTAGGKLIPFTKAHACGNDFLIVEEDAAAKEDKAALAQRLCSRHTGVGADGVEFFAWMGAKSGRIRLHNADGSVAGLSGNGTRCVAAWMAEKLGSKPGDKLEILTDAGPRVCRINSVNLDNSFSVDVSTNMGTPTLAPHTVRLENGDDITGIAISMGNPHFVVVVDN